MNPILWLELDGVLNVNAPRREDSILTVVDDEPVWTFTRNVRFVEELATAFDVVVLTYRDADSARQILSASGIEMELPIVTADREFGWEYLANVGFERSRIGSLVYGKLPALLEANSPGVWIDPQADESTAKFVSGLLAIPTIETVGLTDDIVNRAMKWADYVREEL